jgi:hypothetical protein
LLLRQIEATLISKRTAKVLVASSVLFYYFITAVLLASTNFCNACSASTVWKYGVVAGLPTWLAFLYLYSIRRKKPSVPTSTLRGCTPLLFGLGLVLITSIWLAPLITFLAFAQIYEIVYVDPIRFPFSAAMTVLFSVTLGLMSYNLGSAWPSPVSEDEDSRATCWRMAELNFSLIAWLVVALQHLVTQNEPIAFSILVISTTTIPIFSQLQRFLRNLPRQVMRAAPYVGIGSLATALGALGFLIGFPLYHPFLVASLWFTIGVCISSAVGQRYSCRYDLGGRTTISTLRWLSPAFTLLVLFVALTWLYSHAFVSVVISEIIHVQ